MLDIGKLIPDYWYIAALIGFSSMLDIGKLIPLKQAQTANTSFSSMLDIGKLILKYRSGIDRTFAVACSI